MIKRKQPSFVCHKAINKIHLFYFKNKINALILEKMILGYTNSIGHGKPIHKN